MKAYSKNKRCHYIFGVCPQSLCLGSFNLCSYRATVWGMWLKAAPGLNSLQGLWHSSASLCVNVLSINTICFKFAFINAQFSSPCHLLPVSLSINVAYRYKNKRFVNELCFEEVYSFFTWHINVVFSGHLDTPNVLLCPKYSYKNKELREPIIVRLPGTCKQNYLTNNAPHTHDTLHYHLSIPLKSV